MKNHTDVKFDWELDKEDGIYKLTANGVLVGYIKEENEELVGKLAMSIMDYRENISQEGLDLITKRMIEECKINLGYFYCFLSVFGLDKQNES